VSILLVDDLGWHGVGWRNAEVSTPTLDRLATVDGLRLSRHYCYRTCSPSRSALLTGRLAHHVNQANPNNRHPGGGVGLGFTLLPELLRREKGYATHFLGKWHLGLGTRELLPTYRGFDTWLGYFAGAEDHWTQRRAEARHDLVDLWFDDGTEKTPDGGGPARGLEGRYYGDELYTRRFESLVRNHPPERPFFAYFAYQCVHDPLQAPRRFLKKYAAFDGVDPGDDSAWAFFERNGAPNEPPHAARRRAQYEAMASFVDESVGRVEAALKARGMWRDSLVVFATDNGGAVGFDADSGNNWPLRGGKYSDFEGGVRGVCFVAGGRLPDRMRGVELESHAQRLSIADWYATVADAAGVASVADATAAAAGLPPVDSRSAWPLITGASKTGPRAGELVLSVPSRDGMPGSGGGILVGKWKALFNNQRSAVHNGPTYPNGSAPAPVLFVCGDVRAGRGCLFDLDADPGEARDVSNDRPDVLADLVARFTAAAETAYTTPKYAVWKNETAVRGHIARIGAAYGGFWGPYVSLADAEAAPFFELPPQPWDKAHRPALVEAQKRDYARRASHT
jgi:arylsulfatase A-like enzyme